MQNGTYSPNETIDAQPQHPASAVTAHSPGPARTIPSQNTIMLVIDPVLHPVTPERRSIPLSPEPESSPAIPLDVSSVQRNIFEDNGDDLSSPESPSEHLSKSTRNAGQNMLRRMRRSKFEIVYRAPHSVFTCDFF